MITGPRGVKPAEMDALRKLTDVVFRPNMPEQYPQLFNLDNCENLRVCFDDAVCVSHVGMTQREAILMGCRIRVCCIGAVCTHPEYRKQGLASTCFDDAVAKARADGVDVMIVSGKRSLYIRNGCLDLGRDFKATIKRGQLEGLAADLDVRIWQPGDIERIAECYRKEPVRFVRPPDDYRYLLQSGWAQNAPNEILTIRQRSSGRAFLGYIILRKQEPGKATSVTEFGGDRQAVLAALREVIRQFELAELNLQIMGSDAIMQTLCTGAGVELTPTSASGTIKLINFPQVMQRMQPRFGEILDAKTVGQLRFSQVGDRYRFALGKEAFETDRDTATYAVFGSPDGLPDKIRERKGALGDALRAILPLPTLWYGINYV